MIYRFSEKFNILLSYNIYEVNLYLQYKFYLSCSLAWQGGISASEVDHNGLIFLTKFRYMYMAAASNNHIFKPSSRVCQHIFI